MTAPDWIALLGIALPLVAKVAVDLAAFLAARKHTALARIVDMAGRQAATAARTLTSLPAGVDRATAERALIRNSTEAVLREMDASAVTVGATDTKVASIVQGELDKRLAPVVPTPAAAPGGMQP